MTVLGRQELRRRNSAAAVVVDDLLLLLVEDDWSIVEVPDGRRYFLLAAISGAIVQCNNLPVQRPY